MIGAGAQRIEKTKSLVVFALVLVALMAVSLLLTARPAHAATLTVDRTDDPGIFPDNSAYQCTSALNDCSLRGASVVSSTNAQNDTINFASGISGTLALGLGPIAINDDTSADPDVSIEGPGASTLSVSGGDVTRVFEIGSGAKATISGLTIKNGKAPAGGSNGGGLANSGTLTLNNSTVSANKAPGSGGGGLANSGTLTLNDSTVSGNQALVGGGLINADAATLTLNSSTVSGNQADSGGGLFNGGGTLTLNNSTVSANQALGGGGGIENFGGGTLTLTHATLNGNSAPKGANLLFGPGPLSMRATILANPLGGGANCGRAIHATVISQGFNLEFPGTGCGSEVQSNPLLAPLANNGGLTQTHALQPGSAAIDIVTTSCPPPATDQRGVSRPQDGDKNGNKYCDIGAFENDITPPTVTTTTPTAAATGVPRNVSPTATYSEEMNPNTLTTSTVKLQQRVRKKIRGQWRWRWVPVSAQVSCDNPCKTVTLDPYGASTTLLAPNRSHRVTITTGVRDEAGNALAQNYSWSFTTGSS